ILTSRQPADFTPHVSRSLDYLTDSTFFRGRFVVVGSYGTILQSDVLGAELKVSLEGTGIRLTASGEPGEQYRLQASSDLVNWVTLQSLSLPDGTATYLDPALPPGPHRFYRLVAP